MAKIAPLSRAVATVIPLLMADWVWARLPWVWLRYCSAVMAPVLVFTLKDMDPSVLSSRVYAADADTLGLLPA